MYTTLEKLRVPRKMMNLIKMTTWNNKHGNSRGNASECIYSKQRFEQNDPLFKTLFDFILENVLRENKVEPNGMIQQNIHQIIACANDKKYFQTNIK